MEAVFRSVVSDRSMMEGEFGLRRRREGEKGRGISKFLLVFD